MLPWKAAVIAQVNLPGEGAHMSAPPTSAPSPTTELAPLRSSPPSSTSPTASSNTAATSSTAKPRQPGTSSSPRGSVPWSQPICTWQTEMERSSVFFSKFTLQNQAESVCWCTLLTCWGLSGGQRPTCEVALASAGLTVCSSVGDSWNLAAPWWTAASFSASVVTYRSKKRGFISLYWPTGGSDQQYAQIPNYY